jgi:hypothetical protein
VRLCTRTLRLPKATVSPALDRRSVSRRQTPAVRARVRSVSVALGMYLGGRAVPVHSFHSYPFRLDLRARVGIQVRPAIYL